MANIGIYKSKEPVRLNFALDMLSADSASYTVKDRLGNDVALDIPVDLSGGSLTIDIVVPAEYNTLNDADRDLRKVILSVVTGSTTVSYEQTYILLNNFELTVPQQSFATIAEAQMFAIDMVNGDSLIDMEPGKLRRTLLEATNRIKSMSFSLRKIFGRDDGYYDCDYPQNMINPSSLPSGFYSGYRHGVIDWKEVNDELFAELPKAFRDDLLKAVINEACELASGNDVQSAREDGIVSESIGETTLAYRQGKSAVTTVSRSTWRMLTRYVNTRTIVRR